MISGRLCSQVQVFTSSQVGVTIQRFDYCAITREPVNISPLQNTGRYPFQKAES